MPRGLITLYDSTDSTYLLMINPAKTSYVYNKDGSMVNTTDTLGVFSFTLYEDGVDISDRAGMSINWSTPLAMSMVTGSSLTKEFSPSLATHFDIAKSNNQINLRVLYNGVTLRATQPISITKVSEDGSDGDSAKFVWLTSSSSIIKYDKEGENPEPHEVIVTASTQNLDTRIVEWYQVRADGTMIGEITADDGVQFIGGELVQNPKIKFTPQAKLWGGKSSVYIKVVIDGMEDTTSVTKLKDGADGQTGKSYRNRGTWESGLVYGDDEKYIDTVRYEGSLYECLKKTNPGIKPTDARYWFLLVEKGDAGPALDWIEQWDSNKVQIGNSAIIAPKIFLGQNSAGEGETPVLSGIAIGTDVNGSYDSTIGIVGYNDNSPNFEMQTNGAVWFGRDPKRRLTIHDDGTLTTPDITADTIKGGTLKLGGSLRDITGNEGLENTNGKLLVFGSSHDLDIVNDDQAIVRMDVDGITMTKGKIQGSKTLIDVTEGGFFVGEFRSDGMPDTTKAHLQYANTDGKYKLSINASEINFVSDGEGGGNLFDRFDEFDQRLDEFSNDSIVTPIEKSQLTREVAEIDKEFESLISEGLEILGAETENIQNYKNSYNQLTEYIETLTSDRETNSNVDREQFISYFNAYYICRGLVEKDISMQHVENDKAAIQLIDDISNDLIVTPSEKNELARQFAGISAEYSATVAHAGSVGIPSNDIDLSNYKSAFTSLNQYLYGENTGILTPENIESNTSIDNPSEIRDIFGAYYRQKSLLLKAITDKDIINTNGSISSATNKLQIQLDNMAIDSLITPVEKTSLRKQLSEIESEKDSIISQCEDIVYDGNASENLEDAEVASLISAHTNLKNYLLLTLKIESEKSTTTPVDATIMKSKFNAYFSARDGVISKIYRTHKEQIEETQEDISNMGKDNIITPVEKIALDREFKTIVAERLEIVAQAATYGVSTSNYTEAYNSLNEYLYSDPGILSNLTIEYTMESSVEFNSKFEGYYNAKAKVMTAIVTGTKTSSNQIQDDINKAIERIETDIEENHTDLANIFNDSNVTPDEKRELKIKLEEYESEYQGLKRESQRYFINVIPSGVTVGHWKYSNGSADTSRPVVQQSASFWDNSRDDIVFSYEYFGAIHPVYQNLIDKFIASYEQGLRPYLAMIVQTDSELVQVNRGDMYTKYDSYAVARITLLEEMAEVEHNIKSSFKQSSDSIDMVVGSTNIKDGKWNADSLLSQINISPGVIKIAANKVQINGELTLGEFMGGASSSHTIINGGVIKTGTISLGGSVSSNPVLNIKNYNNTIVTNMDKTGIATIGDFILGSNSTSAGISDFTYGLRYASGALDIKAKSASIESSSKIQIASGGNLNILSGGSMSVRSAGKLNIESQANFSVKSGGRATIESGGDLVINSGGDLSITSGGKFSLTSTNVVMDNGKLILKKSDGTPLFNFTGSSLTLGSGVKLRWDSVVDENGNSGTSITEELLKTTDIVATNLTVKAANISGTLAVDQLDVRNINIGSLGGTLSWSSIGDKPYIPGESDFLDAWEDSGYSTYIGSNGIYTGKITANQIKAGTVIAGRLQREENSSAYMEIGSQYSDIGFYVRNKKVFEIFDDIDSITFKVHGKRVMRLSSEGTVHFENNSNSEAVFG